MKSDTQYQLLLRFADANLDRIRRPDLLEDHL